jgi:beta-lactam-binding protein with PASTA domain/class 3 adenylate cyclase/tRNA A-37 threonylcarbamoyl transferase component Bud32
MIDAPTSTVTFLFADAEDSVTSQVNRYTWERELLERYEQILRKAVEDSGGSVCGTPEGHFCAVFATVKQGVEAAIWAQQVLSAERNGHARKRVRMVLHTEVADERDGEYFEPPVDRAARLLSMGSGGQVLLSDDTYRLVRDTVGISELGAELSDLGEHPLEDTGGSERIFQLVIPDLPVEEQPKSPYLTSNARYVPKMLIGSGGVSEVYLALDRQLDRDVAFKRLRQQYAHDLEVVERFEREAKSAASLSHPNIVSVYDRAGTEDGSYHIVMEHVPGGNLKERIIEEGPFSPNEATAIALQVARALKAAHECGIVHRDIKPENVLLTKSGEAKVADFGIARAVAASTVTKTGFVMGTAHYLSPEQALGHPATPRSDLYSLGVVLYEMLTGEVPHDAETQVGIVMKHVSGRPLPPKDVNPEVPEGLDAVATRLLARDPEDRYQDADELIVDLERVQRDEPLAMAETQQLEQRPPSPATAPPKASRDDNRRSWRWVPIPLILLLLVLLGGIAYAFGPWRTAPEAVVPHLVGASSIEEARELAGDRFEVVEGSRVEGTEAVGTIVAQDPYAGEMAEDGSEISVDTVGTRVAEVPDVQGKTREEAERILKEAGFEIEVKTARSSAEDENLVIEQNPRGDAGKTAKVGSVVAITVGEGPANVEVPSINDQALNGTEQILEDAGLKLGSQMEVPNDRVPAGHIVEQHPAAGTEVERGSTVDVVVSSGPQRPPTPNTEDATQTLGSTAPASTAPASAATASAATASTAPASAAPVLTADDEGEFEHGGEFEDEFGDEDSSGPDHGGHGGPGRH